MMGAAVGSQPVAAAAEAGHRDVVLRMLSEEAGCPDASTGLYFAAAFSHLPSVERFLAAGKHSSPFLAIFGWFHATDLTICRNMRNSEPLASCLVLL